MPRVREQTMPTERPPLSAKLVQIIADRGFHVVSVTDPYCHILGFLDRSRYFFFQVVYSSSLHSFYMPCSSHTSWLLYSNYTWRRVQVM
jgi:hypothetical protein